jgi:hypothetical protein
LISGAHSSFSRIPIIVDTRKISTLSSATEVKRQQKKRRVRANRLQTLISWAVF